MAKGRSTVRNFRIPDALWEQARAIADARFETLSDVVRRALVEYVTQNEKR